MGMEARRKDLTALRNERRSSRDGEHVKSIPRGEYAKQKGKCEQNTDPDTD